MADPKLAIVIIPRAMRNDLIEIFGNQLRWFGNLSKEHRMYVIYFILSFCLLFTVASNLALLCVIVLNFGNSVRLLKRVPNDLED